MKQKILRSIVIGGIATAFAVLLGVILNSTILNAVLLSAGYSVYVIISILLNSIESIGGMVISTIIYSKIYKVSVPTKLNILVSVGAGIIEAVATQFIPIPYSIIFLSYVISFIIFSLFAFLIVRNTNSNTQTNAMTTTEQNTNNAVINPTGLYVNEELSLRAQPEFTKRLTELTSSGFIVDEITEAKLFAECIELTLLKSPASAKFCSLDEITVVQSGNLYIVSGYVDSQNSYGAIIRTPFTCRVFKDTYTWKSNDRLESVETSIRKKVVSNYIYYWIIGGILTLISFLVWRFILSGL